MAAKNFLVDINLSTNEIQNAVVHGVTAFPTSPSPKAGQICYRTDLSMMYQYDGSTWKAVGNIYIAGTNISISGSNVISNTAYHAAEAVGRINGSSHNIELFKVKQSSGEVDVDLDSPVVIHVDPNADPLSSSNPLATVNTVDDAVNTATNDLTVAVTSNTTDTSVAKTYVISQGGQSIGEIKIPKDLVVESGSIVTGTWSGSTFTPDSSQPGSGTSKALALVLANNAGVIYISVNDLVDVYAEGDGIDISALNVISLEKASSSNLGGVTIGSNITVNNGQISITGANVKGALGNQSPNTVFAGPASGSSSAAPTFRQLVAADLPNLDSTFVKAYKVLNPSLTPAGGVVSWTISNTSFGNGDGTLSQVAVFSMHDGLEVGVSVTHSSNLITIKFNSSSTVEANKYAAIIHTQKA